MTVDAVKEIRRAVDTGKVVFGYRETEKSVLKGSGQIIIVAKNCPPKVIEKMQYLGGLSEIPFFEADQSSVELGSVCGKPFLVSTMLVLDSGKSKVLDLAGISKSKAKKTVKKRVAVAKKAKTIRAAKKTKTPHRSAKVKKVAKKKR